MRKGFENFALAGVLAAGLGGKAEALADKTPRTSELQMPREFTKTSLPIKVLPKDFKSLEASGHAQQFAIEDLDILEKQVGCTGVEAYKSLDPIMQQDLAKNIFETSRLYGSAARNSLIGQEYLDTNVANFLNQHVQKLGKNKIHCKDYSQLAVWIRSHQNSKIELYKLYATVNELVMKYKESAPLETSGSEYRQDVHPEPVAEPPRPSNSQPSKPPIIERGSSDMQVAVKNGKVEYVELPPGADGFDDDGQPYGFNFQGFTYDLSALDLSDIRGYDPKSSASTEYQLGITTGGSPTKAFLKPDAYQAFMGLVTEFNQVADPDLRQMGLHVTEALRDNERQHYLRQKLGEQAALPGKSEHLLGKTIDLTNGNNQKMYEWFMEPSKALADKNHIPRAVRHGYIPTIKKETWHYRYVGVQKAADFWKKHRKEIIDNHTKLLRSEFIAPKLTT